MQIVIKLLLYNFRMSQQFKQAMQQRFVGDLKRIQYDGDDSDHDSERSDDYYQYQKKRIQAALTLLKSKPNNSILQELKKNTANENDYLDQFQDEVAQLHNITRNNQKNVLQETVIKQIKQKVMSASMLNTMQLSDQVLENKKRRQESIQNEEQKSKSILNQQTNLLKEKNQMNQKIERAKMEREISFMGRQDERSMKYEQQILSNFFSQRFFTPKFKLCSTKQNNIVIEDYAPKTTLSSLRPMQNVQTNYLPKNAPQLALRRLSKSKKIKFLHSSSSEIQVKIKKLNPQKQNIEQKAKTKNNEIKKLQIQTHIQEYLSLIKPFFQNIDLVTKNYKPKFVNEFPNKNQQNFNIEYQQKESKSVQLCLQVENPKQIKDIKLTFENINNLEGIDRFPNVEHASLQFNHIVSLNSIQNCNKLIQLNLSNNKIKKIEPIKNLKFLKILNLEHNNIENIQLKGGSLQILYASHNRIQQITDLSQNSYMKRIFISYNNLHQFQGLRKLHLLEEIDAHNNFITNLKGIQQCILLRNLNVSCNRLRQLHQKFTYFFLNKLSLSENSLAQLPSLFLPSLQQLYLDHNKIQSLSSPILYLPNLKVLNLDDNKLSGFCVVWSIIRYSKNLQTLKYDKNDYFLDIREKVKQLYEHIVYKNMYKLQILNQGGFDIGIKKYYQNVYSVFLSSKSMFKQQSLLMQQMQNKIIYVIHQNLCLSELQDKKIKFAETNTFIKHKSISKAEHLKQIINLFLGSSQSKLLHSIKSLFYQHDRFEYNFRISLQKIKRILLKREFYLAKKKKYFTSQKPKFIELFKFIQKLLYIIKLLKVVDAFNQPIKGMGQQKAAIIIQKNWRCYRLRKKYKKIMKNLKAKKQDSDLQQIDLDQYDFDNYQIPEFDFEFPEEMNFDQYIIRPEIFEILNQQEQKRGNKIADSKGNNKNAQIKGRSQAGVNIRRQNEGAMVNNFIEDNASSISHQANRQLNQEQEVQRIMREWKVTKAGALTILNKKKQDQARKRKQKEKYMTATERYDKLKKNRM